MYVKAIFCTREYYTVEALETLVGQKSMFGMKSHEKLLQDVADYKTVLAEKLSQMLWDYTALTVFGEMRHAYNKAKAYNIHVPLGGGRENSYDVAKEYTPESIFKAATSCFNGNHWFSSGYGGKMWGNIASCVSKRNIMPVNVFCDMCFSLSHNSSFYLNKDEAKIFELHDNTAYKKVLDYKFKSLNLVDLIQHFLGFSSERLSKLVLRAETLGMISTKLNYERITNDEDENGYDLDFNYNPNMQLNMVLSYEPLEWGKNILKDVLRDRESGTIITPGYYTEDETMNDGEQDNDDQDNDEQEEEHHFESPLYTKHNITTDLDTLLGYLSVPVYKERGAM